MEAYLSFQNYSLFSIFAVEISMKQLILLIVGSTFSFEFVLIKPVYLSAENFKATDVCHDAKETCNNWFCKIGSIRELLPRM